MSNYTKPSISGYNTNPPPDDATTGADNQLQWSKHKTKLADPVKTLLDSVNDQCDAAFGKLFLYAVTTVTATSTIATSSRDKLIKTTNAITLTLPPAATAGDGFAIAVYNSDASLDLTLDGDSAETINGAATLVVGAGDYAILVCNGTNWDAMRNVTPTSVPVGMLGTWPTATPPTGWLVRDGSAISRTTYADLFAVIGTLYGVGDGSTTFNLPDVMGEFPRFYDGGAGVDPDAASRTDRGDGTTGDSVGTKQAGELEAHTHTETRGNYVLTFDAAGGSGALRNAYVTVNTGSTGGNETRPINSTELPIIKY